MFFPDGAIAGTLGGGCLEAEVQDRARSALIQRKPCRFDLLLDHDFGWDDGLICGGRVAGVILPEAQESRAIWAAMAVLREPRAWGVREDFTAAWAGEPYSGEWLYRETFRPPTSLWIAGAGHVARAVSAVALRLGFEVSVFDDRSALANHRFFDEGVRLAVAPWEELLALIPPASGAFGLILTRGHQHDARVLRHWVRRPFAFLGMIGSTRKRRLLFSQLVDEGHATEAELSAVACPVGAEIGAVSVEEIAISIAAQLVQRRAALAPVGG